MAFGTSVASLAAVLGSGLLAGGVASQMPPRPFPGALYPASLHNPSGIVAADLDGDGLVDLAVSEDPHGGGWMEPPSNVSVLLNLGAGRFRPAVEYPLGWHATGIAAGDLDGDGDVDLAVPHHAGGGLIAMIGDGQGGFGTSLTLCPSIQSWAVVLGDLDGDGWLDAVAGDDLTHGLFVVLGTGGGAFAPPQRLPLGADPRALAAGDLDADGDLDLVATAGFVLWTLLGDGDGGFGPASATSLPSDPRSIALADLNGDAVLDFTCSGGDAGFLVLRGDGAGGWHPVEQHAARVALASVAVTDLDQDGSLDLVGAGQGRIAWRLGDGAGAFGPPTTSWACLNPAVLAVSELDGDGHADAVVTGWLNSGVTVLAGRAQGGFEGSEPLAIETSDFNACAGALADLDGDSVLDLVLNQHAPISFAGVVSARRGRGDGTFEPALHYRTGGSPAGAPAFDDLNQDGWLDVVAGRGDGVAVLLGTGGGALSAPSLALALPAPAALALGDLQGDGPSDLVVAHPGSSSVIVALGLGQGLFGSPSGFAVGAGPRALALDDLNADGVLDVAVACQDSGEVGVLLGLGDGAFLPALHLAVGNIPSSLAIGDLDGDGWPDLAVSGTSLALLAGDGQGGFTPFGEPLPQLGASQEVHLAEIDADADLDLVLGQGPAFAVLHGLGTGGFQLAELVCPAGALPFSRLGDLDLDGDVDLVVVDSPLGAAYLNRTVESARR